MSNLMPIFTSMIVHYGLMEIGTTLNSPWILYYRLNHGIVQMKCGKRLSNLRRNIKILMGQILHGDCLELLPRLVPKESIDLVLADPPYGITSAGFDCEVDLIKLWPQLWRVAKLHCPIIFTASQPFSSIVVLSQIDYFKHEWIWIKNRGSNFANTVREPMKEHEHILVFAKHKWV